MPRLVFESVIPCSVQELWDFHGDVSALGRLTPPGNQVTILSEDTAVRNGALHVLRVKKNGLPLVWKARISEVEPPHRFVDTAEQSPFKSWRHEHAFLEHAQGALLRDTVDYEMPFGPLGALVDRILIRKDLEAMFAHRHQVTKAAFKNRP